VVTLRARQRSAADATTAGARGDSGEKEDEEGGGRGDACDGSQAFLIGAFTRYNYPHVWRLKTPHHAGDCGADADAHESQDRPLPLESIRLWKTKNTRVWDFVRELLTTYGNLSEHENAFAVDFDSLRRMDSAGGFESMAACIGAAGMMSFLRYAIETHSIRLTQDVLEDVRGLSSVHVVGMRHALECQNA